MDIQKMIEEESQRFNSCVSTFFNSQEAYLEGLEKGVEILQHANRWRKVSEELPEKGDAPLLVKVEIDYNDEDIEDQTMILMSYFNRYGFTEYYFPKASKYNVTEWKPIE